MYKTKPFYNCNTFEFQIATQLNLTEEGLEEAICRSTRSGRLRRKLRKKGRPTPSGDSGDLDQDDDDNDNDNEDTDDDTGNECVSFFFWKLIFNLSLRL